MVNFSFSCVQNNFFLYGHVVNICFLVSFLREDSTKKLL